jgi:hypothetical protein
VRHRRTDPDPSPHANDATRRSLHPERQYKTWGAMRRHSGQGQQARRHQHGSGQMHGEYRLWLELRRDHDAEPHTNRVVMWP